MRWISVLLLFVIVIYAAINSFESSFNTHRVSRETKQLVEISQLSEAMRAYQETHVDFPPSFADSSEPSRKKRFMRHLAVSFPNANYGVTVENFDRLNQMIQNDWAYNYAKSDGSIHPLDLTTLDPAEALVFWLGGFPMPRDAQGNSVGGRKLFGYHKDTDNPFKRVKQEFEAADPLRFRTDPLYNFDQTRLVDWDDDGWLEYVAMPVRQNEIFAPFVYFDSDTYYETMDDRESVGTCFYPHDVRLAALWGTAIPYLAAFDAQNPKRSTWKNVETVQIVGPGIDGKYGPLGDGNTLPTLRVVALSDPPAVYSAADGFQQSQPIDHNERDNLTNLMMTAIDRNAKDNEQSRFLLLFGGVIATILLGLTALLFLVIRRRGTAVRET